jgi:vacuolar protein sorting-associated protein 29
MYNKARKMGVEILIIGHTHEMKVTSHNGVHFINPGSMTGAYSTLNMNSNPTFMIL